jgi:hypothetical protein
MPPGKTASIVSMIPLCDDPVEPEVAVLAGTEIVVVELEGCR